MGADWNAKVESQEIHRVTEKFGLGVQNEAGQRLTVLPSERTGYSKHPFPMTLNQKRVNIGNRRKLKIKYKYVIQFRNFHL